MRSSPYLRDKYSQPIYGNPAAIPSRNFSNQVWWQISDGRVVDPYQLLPPFFADIQSDELDRIEDDTDGAIREGGAAGMAYARLQFEDLPVSVRGATKAALLLAT